MWYVSLCFSAFVDLIGKVFQPSKWPHRQWPVLVVVSFFVFLSLSLSLSPSLSLSLSLFLVFGFGLLQVKSGRQSLMRSVWLGNLLVLWKTCASPSEGSVGRREVVATWGSPDSRYHVVVKTLTFEKSRNFKRSRQNISRIENQRQKIEFFFIMPKHPFLWTSFEKNIFKFQRFSLRLKFKKVWKLVKITVFPLPKRSNRHATLERCWPR